MFNEKRKSKVITFYSYKGGAGRSSTTLNTLPFLVDTLHADEKHPLLLIDMDLDSAGMTYLLGCEKYFKKNYDVKEFLINEEKWSDAVIEDIYSSPLIKKFVPVGDILGVEKNSILFLGDNDEKPIDNNQMDGAKENIMKKLKRFCKNNNLPGVILDSSAGDQFSALLATKIATQIVCCMRPTTQFRVGTFNYLERLARNNVETNIILLPTVVPNEDVCIDGEFQKKQSIEKLNIKIEQIKSKYGASLDIHTDFVDAEMLGINEVQRFKWKEGVLFSIGKTQPLLQDEQEAYERYKKLAIIISEIGD